MRQSLVLLNNTQTTPNVTGDAVKASGYYGNGNDNYTVSINLSNFSGRIRIQGTLANDPCCSNADWFDVVSVIEYAPHTPDTDNMTGVTKIQAVNFTGSYVWLRAVVDRSYLPNPGTVVYGAVMKMLVNF